MRRWVAFFVAWAVVLVGMAVLLARWSPPPGSLLHAMLLSEPVHVLCHTGLFAVLAAVLASGCLRAPRPRALAGRAWIAGVAFAAVAMSQEGAQALAAGRRVGTEELYDLGVDALGGTVGLCVWTLLHPEQTRSVARALGWILHPALVAPLGLFALYWSVLRAWRAALPWCALGVACALPVALAWRVGLRTGRFTDGDLSVRRERRPFLVFGAAWALAYVALATVLDAPPVVLATAACGALGALAMAAVTCWGLKASGHVAVPWALAVALAATSPRGVWCFALAAALLAWARVREERHTAREVVGGCVLATLVTVAVFHGPG